MSKLNEDMIGRIQAYPEEMTNSDVGRELWIDRRTVAKYRRGLEEVLEAKEEKKLTREEKKQKKEEEEKYQIIKNYSPKELKEILSHLQTNTTQSIDKVIGDKGHLKFALLGDTHIGNKMSAKKELADFYKRAGDEWVEAFIHCGDLVDGTGHVFKGQVYELENVWYDEQLKAVVNDYPYYWDIKTYVVGGNHDESFLKENGANIIKNIAHLRDDIIDMWFYDARIKLNGVDINAHHGGWHMSYAKSYKPQKLIENIDPRNQPHIFASWHWHEALYMAYRNIHSFLPGAFLKQNLLAKRFNLWNTIWWWIVEVDIKEDGSSIINMKFIEY